MLNEYRAFGGMKTGRGNQRKVNPTRPNLGSNSGSCDKLTISPELWYGLQKLMKCDTQIKDKFNDLTEKANCVDKIFSMTNVL
jgi:hypothetical protein